MTREELLRSPEYWTTKLQLELYARIEEYMVENKINRTELAKRLGVSKGYVTQILNGDYDHRLSKLVEISLKINCIPIIVYEPIESVIDNNGLYKIKTEVQCPNIEKLNQNSNFLQSNNIITSQKVSSNGLNSYSNVNFQIIKAA